MEQNFSSLGIVVIILLLVILFYVISYKAKSKVTDVNLKLFNAFQDRIEISCDKVDSWRDNYFIGLDSNRKTIAYVNKRENFEEVYGLSKYNSVLIHKVFEGGDFKNSTNKKIHHLILRLIPSSTDDQEVNIEFYNRTHYSSIDSEMELLNKWESIISENLQSKKE